MRARDPLTRAAVAAAHFEIRRAFGRIVHQRRKRVELVEHVFPYRVRVGRIVNEHACAGGGHGCLQNRLSGTRAEIVRALVDFEHASAIGFIGENIKIVFTGQRLPAHDRQPESRDVNAQQHQAIRICATAPGALRRCLNTCAQTS